MRDSRAPELFLFLVGVAAPLFNLLTGHTSWTYIAWLVIGTIVWLSWYSRRSDAISR